MRKRRTREHIIADLSVNYVERYVLRAGHIVQRIDSDYGYDLILTTFDANGEVERGIIYLQLKATDHIRLRQDSEAISFTLDLRDLNLWRGETIPVILIIYDAVLDAAYWLHIQEAAISSRTTESQSTVTVSVPVQNLISVETVEQFRQRKAAVFP